MGPKIYLDTNLFIYFFEDNPAYSSKVEKLLTDSLEADQQIIASPLLVTELLAGPIKDRVSHLITIYSDLPQIIASLKFVSFDVEVAKIAAGLRAKYRLPTPDCIHLATAIHAKCVSYYTNDKNLQVVKKITVTLI